MTTTMTRSQQVAQSARVDDVPDPEVPERARRWEPNGCGTACSRSRPPWPTPADASNCTSKTPHRSPTSPAPGGPGWPPSRHPDRRVHAATTAPTLATWNATPTRERHPEALSYPPARIKPRQSP